MQAGCFRLSLLAAVFLGSAATRITADEGFWLFNDPPRKQLKERYGFELTDAWLGRVQRAAVAFSGGGSGSFVSPDGLILTNHHVAADALSAVRVAGKVLGQNSFLARTREQEVRCPGLGVSILESVEDVTERIRQAVKPEMKPAQAYRAKDRAVKMLEKESEDRTGLPSSVIELYEGAAYHLYRYKHFTDVRLVFLPELEIGGAFDVCFLRAYENDKPAKVGAYFRASREPARDGDLAFLAGNPGATQRRSTVLEMEQCYRACTFSYRRSCRYLAVLADYRACDPKHVEETEIPYQRAREQERTTALMLPHLEPDSQPMKHRRAQEEALRKAIDENPAARAACVGAWERMAEANKRYLARYETDYRLYADALAFRGSLFGIARFLVRAGEEADKPAADRLDGFDDYTLRIGRREIVEAFPVYPDFEVLQLADSLSLLVEEKGEQDELVRKVLAGKSPKERATELIRNTKMGDPKVRETLFDGKAKAIEVSTDCMVALARLVDPIARRVTEEAYGEISEVMSRERLRISEATQIVRGADSYPDATSTLRLTFGKLASHQRTDLATDGLRTMAEVFTVAEMPEAQGWYRIPAPWKKLREKMDLQTVFHLTVHCDVNNGSSGSPAIGRSGELLGVACRIPNGAISLNYQYKDELARVWAISTPAILEVLSKAYEAAELVQELTGKPAAKSGN
jgi:hypothetical protein